MAKNHPKKPDTFTANQVGVLIEELRGEFRVFGEGLDNINCRLDRLWKEVEVIRVTLGRTLERVTRIELTQRKFFNTHGSHDGRISLLEKAVFK